MILKPYTRIHKDGTTLHSYIDVMTDLEDTVQTLLEDLDSGYDIDFCDGLICTEEDYLYHGDNYGNILWGRVMSWV